MIRTLIGRPLRAHRPVLIVALAICALGAIPSVALGAPEWGIDMTHANAFGVEGTFDPSTGSGTTFARESGGNTYTITVSDKKGGTAGERHVGEPITCQGGPMIGASLTYQWLRNGMPIVGATASSYTPLAKEDEGKLLQCQVTAEVTNKKGETKKETVAVSQPALISPSALPTPPLNSGVVIANASEETGPQAPAHVGELLKCTGGEDWNPSNEGTPAFAWLRSGEVIAGQTSETYEVQKADEGKALQCEATATFEADAAVAVSAVETVLAGGTIPGPPVATAAIPNVVTVVDELPPGLRLDAAANFAERHNSEVTADKTIWECGAQQEGTRVECSTSAPLTEGHSYPPIEVLAVGVEGNAAPPSDGVGTLTNVATVSGGGQPASTTPEEGKTTITPAVPFGIASFVTGLFGEAPREPLTAQPGAAFTQAGGHPFAFTTEIRLNARPSGEYTGTPGHEFPESGVAGGLPKEVQVELPPGFVGDLQNTPRCPPQLLLADRCPRSAAVGYVHASLGGHVGPKGLQYFPQGLGTSSENGANESNSPLFNLQPAPGHLVALGLTFLQGGVPLILEGNVRTDGDYGVTIGSVSVPNSPAISGTLVTTCENGISEIAGSGGGSFACNPASPTSKPFLTNPTQCTGEAPVTTLYANSYQNQPTRLSKTVPTGSGLIGGVANEESLITGCEKLHFKPTMEFKPSPPSEGGSTQADAPTGMTLGVKIPQTDEAQTLATPALRDLEMTLPRGMTVSPSAGHGLQACSDEQFGYGTEFGPGTVQGRPEIPAKEASCPLASQIAAVEVFTPLLSSAPTVEGVTASVGLLPAKSLKCTAGTWSVEPEHVSYRWLRNGVLVEVGKEPLSGKEYPLSGSEPEGTSIQCQETAESAAGDSVALSRDVVVSRGSGQSPAVEGVAKTPPLPKGSTALKVAGSTLECSPLTFVPAPTALSYSWLRNGEPIENEKHEKVTGKTYTTTAADDGRLIQCQTKGESGEGATVGVSLPSAISPAPTKFPVAPTSVVEPRGVPTIGNVLTCIPGAWKEGPAFAYRWLRNGEAIGGATASEYTLTSADAGDAIQCQVVGTNASGAIAIDSEAAIVRLTPAFPPPSIAEPSRLPSGELACAPGAWEYEPSFTYRWLRNGTEIKGANGEMYNPGAEDEGKAIQCQVRGKNAAPGETVADSAPIVLAPVPANLPLPGAPLQGSLFVAEPHCGPCSSADAEDGNLFRLFLQLHDRRDGVLVKLVGVSKVTEGTGQITTVFKEQPEQAFELLKLKVKGGPLATLANSQNCGPATTSSVFTPWSAPGLGGLDGKTPVGGTTPSTPGEFEPASTFEVTGCAGSMPFAPAFTAGTVGANATLAGSSTSFLTKFSRKDGEQDLSGVTVNLPGGLAGKIPAVKERCSAHDLELAEKEEGECPAGSKLGTATAGAGPGERPYFETGNAYLMEGPYKNAPFGLAVVTPARTPAFNLGNVVVRSEIKVNSTTGAVSVVSDPLPQFKDGVQLRLRQVNVEVNKPGFMLNPTNCNEQQVTSEFKSFQGASSKASSRFAITGCKNLLFHPIFTATTEGHTSKTTGASLSVKLVYQQGSNYANIAKTITDLPIQLPSRLETLHKACPDTVFEANPAMCPEGSDVGTARAKTPELNAELTGPAYLVSHGNRAFPDLQFVLQGEGVTIVLDGHTDIKNGVTKTTFEGVPDAPVETFEATFPEGSHSVLAAPEDLCEPMRTVTEKQTVSERRNGHLVHAQKTVSKKVLESLLLPTQLVGQNGVVEKQNTVIGVIGCHPVVMIRSARMSGNSLLVTIRALEKGTVKITGSGLAATTANVPAGVSQVRVRLSKKGRSLRARHRTVSVHVGITVGKQHGPAKTASVQL